MRIEYDKEADALYIQLRDASVDDNIQHEEGVTVDIGRRNRGIGSPGMSARNYILEDIVNVTNSESSP